MSDGPVRSHDSATRRERIGGALYDWDVKRIKLLGQASFACHVARTMAAAVAPRFTIPGASLFA